MPASLTEEAVGSFRIAKVFRDNASHVTSLDIDASGRLAVTAASEESALHLYDCLDGEHLSLIMLPARSVSAIKFLPQNPASLIVGCSSSASPTHHDVCLVDLQRGSFSRKLGRHSGGIRSVLVSPEQPPSTVITASVEDGVVLWDLRLGNQPRGRLPFAGPVAIDPQGLVFAACLTASQHLLLYDCRKWEKVPCLGLMAFDLL